MGCKAKKSVLGWVSMNTLSENGADVS